MQNTQMLHKLDLTTVIEEPLLLVSCILEVL